MHIAALMIDLHIPGCRSLKEKRGHLKPLLAQLHRQFNVSAAEIDRNDQHTGAVIACVVVSNSGPHGDRLLATIPGWIESRFPSLQIVDHQFMTV